MNRRRVSDRINMLAGSKQVFNKYLDAYYANEIFGGPSVYFHKKVIACIRQNDYEGLFRDEHFIEYIYATLASWGMHRMGPKGSKMRNFEDFKDSIQTNRSTFLELHKFTIEKLTNDDKKVVYPMLELLLDNIDVMQSESKLVGSSKVIHHLLPDLVPPIDREYTLRFSMVI
jgi:hypothetical protein